MFLKLVSWCTLLSDVPGACYDHLRVVFHMSMLASEKYGEIKANVMDLG